MLDEDPLMIGRTFMMHVYAAPVPHLVSGHPSADELLRDKVKNVCERHWLTLINLETGMPDVWLRDEVLRSIELSR